MALPQSLVKTAKIWTCFPTHETTLPFINEECDYYAASLALLDPGYLEEVSVLYFSLKLYLQMQPDF